MGFHLSSPKFINFGRFFLLQQDFRPTTRWRRGQGRVCARCSLCGGELLRGERGWYLNGQSVCEDCFPAFARAELADCEITFGMEERE